MFKELKYYGSVFVLSFIGWSAFAAAPRIIDADRARSSSKATTVIFPAANDTLMGKATTDTMTNKTFDVNGTGNVVTGIADANISASANIPDSKLATISTAGKVSNSSTTATSANTNSAIVARDAAGGFYAGSVTASAYYGSNSANGNSTIRSTTNASAGNVIISDQTGEKVVAGVQNLVTTFNPRHSFIVSESTSANNGFAVYENGETEFNAVSGTDNSDGWILLPKGPSGNPEIRVSTKGGSQDAYIRPYDSGFGNLYGYQRIGQQWGFMNSNASFITLEVSGTTGQSAYLMRFSNTSDFGGPISGIGKDGEFRSPSGTVALPGHSFFADTNTGMLNPNADQIGFSVGGTERLHIDSTGITVTGSTTLGTALAVGSGGTGSSSTPAAGQIPIGTGTAYTPAYLTAGSNISIVSGSGSIVISSTASGGTGLLGGAWGAESVTVTPSAGFGTTTNNFIKCRRVGDSIQCKGKFTDGTVAASAAYIDIAPQYTIDTSKIIPNAGLGTGVSIGNGGSFNFYTAAGFAQQLFYNGTTATRLYFGFAGAGGVYTENVGSDLNQTGGVQQFEFTYPVSGWLAN